MQVLNKTENAKILSRRFAGKDIPRSFGLFFSKSSNRNNRYRLSINFKQLFESCALEGFVILIKSYYCTVTVFFISFTTVAVSAQDHAFEIQFEHPSEIQTKSHMHPLQKSRHLFRSVERPQKFLSAQALQLWGLWFDCGKKSSCRETRTSNEGNRRKITQEEETSFKYDAKARRSERERSFDRPHSGRWRTYLMFIGKR